MGEKETAAAVPAQDAMFNPKEYSVSRSEAPGSDDDAAAASASERAKGPNAINVKLA